MKYGIASKKGHTINYKRYFLASKIGSNSMLNKIYTKCYKMLENVLEWFGYNYIGYKVDINENYKDIKALKKEIKALKNNINLTN